mgnify:CR=1|jgi:hypothetical protein
MRERIRANFVTVEDLALAVLTLFVPGSAPAVGELTGRPGFDPLRRTLVLTQVTFLIR